MSVRSTEPAAVGEFDLIRKYFDRGAQRAVLGIGDYCALLASAPGMHWAVSCDMLVEGRHFVSTVSPERLGHKALAVNLSDLAACGATPRAFTLALALPRADEGFVAAFAKGLFRLADRHGIELVGGDTTAGPLNICITVFGEVPAGQALLRSGAQAGDTVWVSGQLGDARLALEVFRGTVNSSLLAPAGADFDAARRAMEMPQPRVALGIALRGIATSAIDLSDGLIGDIGHVLRRSGVGARIDLPRLPCSDLLRRQAPGLQRECLLAGGDDYELLFTAPPAANAAVERAGALAGVAVAAIGQVHAGSGLTVLDADGLAVDLAAHRAFDHFGG